MKFIKDFIVYRAKAFSYAVQGIVTVVVSQPNMRIIAVAGVAAFVTGLLLDLNYLEWSFVLVAIFFIWMAETFNSALEFVVDLVSPEFHPLAKKAKDAAAGAVLVAIFLSLCLAGLILLPKFMALFKG
jgi:diacylglycerol kinase